MAKVEQASRGFERSRDHDKDRGREDTPRDRREDGGEDKRDW